MSEPFLALAPEIEESRREEWKPAWLSRNFVHERVHECRLDDEARPRCRPLDRPPQLARAHRPEQYVVLSNQIGELDVGRKTAEEVGPQREQDQHSTLGIPGLVDEHVDEGAPFTLEDAGGKELFELVDRERKTIAAVQLLERLRQLHRRPRAGPDQQDFALERRQKPGAEERRLAAAGRPDNRQ